MGIVRFGRIRKLKGSPTVGLTGTASNRTMANTGTIMGNAVAIVHLYTTTKPQRAVGRDASPTTGAESSNPSREGMEMGDVYAEDTKVPVDRSQSQIKTMLRDVGCDRFAVFEASDENFIVFQHGGTTYKLSCVIPEKGRKSIEQRARASWRALHLLIKAKTVAIKQGITTIEHEFFADTVMPGGETLLDYREDLIAHNYTSGPPLLGFSKEAKD